MSYSDKIRKLERLLQGSEGRMLSTTRPADDRYYIIGTYHYNFETGEETYIPNNKVGLDTPASAD